MITSNNQTIVGIPDEVTVYNLQLYGTLIQQEFLYYITSELFHMKIKTKKEKDLDIKAQEGSLEQLSIMLYIF